MTTKRAFDLCLTLLTAPLWAPALALIAVLVLLADGRPVFFRQNRMGRGGQTFSILKARTMTTEADAAQRQPTRLGAFFRDRGYDELFQVLNIVRGEMSVVGPRPLSRADYNRLCAETPLFARRLEVKPGLTGPCQVASVRGSEATARTDAAYADGHSVPMDIGLIARTLVINVFGKKRARRWFPQLASLPLSGGHTRGATRERTASHPCRDVPRSAST